MRAEGEGTGLGGIDARGQLVERDAACACPLAELACVGGVGLVVGGEVVGHGADGGGAAVGGAGSLLFPAVA